MMPSINAAGSPQHFFESKQDSSNLDVPTILFNCREVKNEEDVKKICPSVIQILSNFDEKQLGEFQSKFLPELLNYPTPFEQQALSLALANRYAGLSDLHNDSMNCLLQAMHYYAKAMQIATIHESPSLKEIHASASSIFIKLITLLLIKKEEMKNKLSQLINMTETDVWAFQIFEMHINRIDLLKEFCVEEKDRELISRLYADGITVCNNISSQSLKNYASSREKIKIGMSQEWLLPVKHATERYWKALKTFREVFKKIDISKEQSPETVRKFQKEIADAFKILFSVFLHDAITILGPPSSTYSKLKHTPPCSYDIRAMGSAGREEICPYSDLEFMILIQDEKAFDYFKILVQLLEIQIASLGETATNNPVFTCIHTKNPSGLHIDGSPTAHPKLMQTPASMAELQRNPVEDPCTIENTVLKTISLYQTDSLLFTEYEKALEETLTSYREERAFKFFTIRLEDYKKHWKQPFNPETDVVNIKKHYVEILHHLLSDMALFYGIEKTNTLDIIDALLELKVFAKESGELLKESVTIIYTIRIRLHTLYKEQKEEGSCQPHPHCKQLLPFEILVLEKCYWLILRPLYEQLQEIITSTELKATFKEMDLIQIAFRKNLSSQTMTKPFIIHLASHLCQINALPETHLAYFRALSELSAEYPRQVYLQVLEKKQAFLPLQRLFYIPNRTGLRPIFLKEHEWIKQGLTVITDPSDTQVPGRTVVCITASHFTKPRYLKPSLIPNIMDGENLKSQYSNSAHSVCALNDQGYSFHLKQKPSHPLMEYAMHNLSSRIAGKLTPSGELVRFEVQSNGRKKSYPVLISETIPGINLKNAKGQYNPAQYTWMLLFAILTRPGDGRLSNYIRDDNGMLYCIDNDISFAEPVIKEWGSRTVYFCSALFCLTTLDVPLDVETLKEFASLDGNAIFHAWIDDLIAKEQTYTSLFSKEEIATFYTEDSKNTFTPTILFKEGAIATLSLQFWQLQNKIAYFLLTEKVMTAGDLLKELISLEEEAIGTFIYKAYNNKGATPEKRLQQATSRKQEHSITSIQSHQICLGKVPTLQDIITKQLYSPQKAKEEFFSTLLQGKTHYASVKTSQGKTEMKANFKELKEEKRRGGLVLKALTEQFKKMDPKPTALILHHSNLLTSDLLKLFLHTQLEELDLRYCEKITNNDVKIIERRCPNLKKLSLAGCKGITNISGTFPNLEDLDVSYCVDLHTLKLDTFSLRNLNGRGNPLLKEVQLISYIAKVDFSASSKVALTHTKLGEEIFFQNIAIKNSPFIEIVVNFRGLKKEEQKQILLLNALIEQVEMMKEKSRTLIFRHNSVLTSDLLEIFLHAGLEKLELRYCEKINNKAVRTIQEQCPNLKELSLAGCIGITEISSLYYQKLEFPNLENLDVSYCINLVTLKLKADLLRNLTGRSNPLFKQVQLMSYIAKVDFAASPQVNLTHTKELEFFVQRNSKYITLNSSLFVAIEANFEELKKEGRRQIFLLNALTEYVKLMKEKPEILIFHHISELTSDLLEFFLHSSLRQLELHNCEKIDNRVISIIQKHCSNLKILSLTGCIGVSEIIESPSYATLINLQELDISHCSNLHKLKLEAHSLINLKGSHTPLSQLILGSDLRLNSVVTSDLLESFLQPSLRQLELHYCEKIDNRIISIIQKQSPDLKALSFIGCIGVTEIMESFPYSMLTNLEDLDVSHCSNLHTLKLQALSLQNLKGNLNLLLQEVKLGSDVVKTMLFQNDGIRPLSFGKKEWAKYFGDIGIEPPLPQNIHEIVNSSCPFWPELKVSDTHLLVLVPETVNEKPLTLDSLQELIQKPKEGHKAQYRYDHDVAIGLGDQSISSHWVLMTRDVIPDSRSKAYEDQKTLLTIYAKKSGRRYELPTALDAVTCILMEYVQTGTNLYSDSPSTYTHCQEMVKKMGYGVQSPVAIGGFDAGRLDVSISRWYDDAYCGVGGSLKFGTMVLGTWAEEWKMVFGDKTGRRI